MLIFRQLFDPQSSTYSYLLGDRAGGQAILIDPVFEQAARDAALIKELDLHLGATIDTHAHADHVTGAWLLKSRLGSKIAISAASGAQGADIELGDGDRIEFGGRYLTALSTPGHTDGCMTFVLDNETMAFTGDALLIRGCGRTDFQQGSTHQLYQSIRTRIFTLPDSCLLYPAHDYQGLTVTSVEEEKSFNPRVGGNTSESDFSGYMQNLGLPHPRQIDVALPANMRCGRPEDETLASNEPSWAPLTFTFAGFWEIDPIWVQEHGDEFQVIDVRGEEEFNGPLGHIRGARLMPLNTLSETTASLDKDKPVVTVCRSGARSAQAVTLLKKAGFTEVANMAGGMLRWNAQNLPAEGARD
ncbi:MAG TPA: rhodanese-like domain-containing protein [Pseudomonadales bacterium]|nr:rhodanese-like domain-containing protein [Pseudomonadales bacterium]